MNEEPPHPSFGPVGPPALVRRVRWAAAVLIAGLVLSGLTAIPLESELALARRVLTAVGDGASADSSSLSVWLTRVDAGVRNTNQRHPFIAYGTDWLAFGHLMIALALVGVWRDPVRNEWLWRFAVIACVAVIPWALFFGGLRGIPWGWRLIDCSFGVLGVIPAALGLRWTRQLTRRSAQAAMR